MVSLAKATFIGFLVAMVSLVIGGAAAGLLHLPVSGVAAVLTGAALMVLTRKRPAIALPVVVSAGFALTPVLIGGTQWALGPLATSPEHTRCGTGDLAIPFVAAVGLLILWALTLCWTLVATAVIRKAPALALTFSALTMLAGCVTVAAGLRSLHRPSPEAFLDLFERMTLEPGGALTIADASFVYEPDVKAAALWGERHCMVYATMPGGEKREMRIDIFDTCPRLHLHHDAATGMFLLTDFEDDSITRSILDANHNPDQVFLTDFRGRLGAPHGWVIGGLLGLLLGTLALASAVATMRRARRDVAAAVEGEHTGGGWLAVAGAAPRFVRELSETPPGPVLVRDEDVRLPTYRDDGKPHAFSVMVGSRKTVLGAARMRAVGWACVAATVAVTASVPLWVAALRGLL